MQDNQLYVLTGYSMQGGYGGLTSIWKCKVCGGHIQVFGDGYPQNYRCPICNAVNKQYPQTIEKTDWGEFL